jgi:hypothetical protein
MIYRGLADLILLLHFGFIVFAVLGGMLALRWVWTPYLHLPVVAWGVFIELTGRVCPLTPLELSLRRTGGQAGYEGGFIEHYITPVIYPDGLTQSVQLGLAAALVVVNVVIYSWVWRRWRRR